eukprot:COSAG02_NODE_893_length_16140_cov_19.677621_10_plen_64_part_00
MPKVAVWPECLFVSMVRYLLMIFQLTTTISTRTSTRQDFATIPFELISIAKGVYDWGTISSAT